ncbi:MAG: cytidylyltransferase domain-containing protein [Candidatus Nitrosopumilus sp. bin_68KS]
MNKIEKENVIIILSRRGTKNIARQNVRLVNGKPLIYYIIKKCQEIKSADIFVSTDSEEIKQLSVLYGVDWLDRPLSLTKDQTPMEKIAYKSLIQLKKKNLNYKKCLILNPHFPLIKTSTINKFFSELNNKKETIFGFQKDVEAEYIKIHKTRKGKKLESIYNNLAEKRKILSFNCKKFLSEKKWNKPEYGIELRKSEIFSPDSYHDFGILENIMKRRRILVRLDGSKSIGLGHVYNMLTVLNHFRNDEILILMNNKKCLGKEKLEENLFKVKLFSTESELFKEITKFRPDIIFNDILNSKIKYMKKIKNKKCFVVNFEDLKEGRKLADLVFNPIFSNYKKFRNEFYGANFACVRDEFRIFKRNTIRRNIEKVTITLGGVDSNNNTLRVIDLIQKNKILKNIHINVILGFGFKHKIELTKKIHQMEKNNYNIKIIEKTDFISKYIIDSDFVITSNGRTVFEIASLKIPIISLSVNSREGLHNFVKESKTGFQIDFTNKTSEKEFIKAISSIQMFAKRKEFLKKLEIIQLEKGIERVVHIINSEYDMKKLNLKLDD